MAEAASGRVRRDEQGEARRANTTPNGGTHLELGRLRHKTWSKSDFSIAETTGPTYLYMYLQGSLSRGGLTPALPPRMPVITDDVVWANQDCKRESTAKGYVHTLKINRI